MEQEKRMDHQARVELEKKIVLGITAQLNNADAFIGEGYEILADVFLHCVAMFEGIKANIDENYTPAPMEYADALLDEMKKTAPEFFMENYPAFALGARIDTKGGNYDA